jgi:hypothetical protein
MSINLYVQEKRSLTMFQRFVRLMVVLAIGVVMVACAAPAAAPGGAEPAGVAPAGERQVLDLWFNSDDLFNQYNEKIIAEFEAANPDIDIVYSPYPNEAYKTNLQVAIGSDDPPDIFFNWAGDDTGRYVREGHLLDLTPYADQYAWGEQLSPAMLAAFSVDDTLYGVLQPGGQVFLLSHGHVRGDGADRSHHLRRTAGALHDSQRRGHARAGLWQPGTLGRRPLHDHLQPEDGRRGYAGG